MRSSIMTLCWVVGLAAAAAWAQSPLAFRPVEEGYCQFDTGTLRGKVRLDGKSQGVCSLVYVPAAMELAKVPGLFSYYRVFSTGNRYGKAARDWPLTTKVLEDGALEIAFAPAADEHPLEMKGVMRWAAPDTLDLQTVVTPQVAMPRMEVFLSSYVAKGFDAWVYLKPNRFAKKEPPAMVRADWSELLDGNYVVFPRERESLLMVYDGRWEIPPSPVTWAFTRYLAAPLAVRRHAPSGLCVAWMSPPEDCFAVSTPYNKEPPDGVAGHSSIYLSLFGRDVAAGETVRASCRLIVGKDLTDPQIIERYEQYVAERKK